jgi:hypothetical protein
MNDNEGIVFLGDPIKDPGERRVLSKLRQDLARLEIPALVFANFVAPGRQQRQIDLLIRTPARLVNAELKVLDQSLPVIGGVNGPWQQCFADGAVRLLDPNPYRQAHNGTYAISDAMRDHARTGAVPSGAGLR